MDSEKIKTLHSPADFEPKGEPFLTIPSHTCYPNISTSHNDDLISLQVFGRNPDPLLMIAYAITEYINQSMDYEEIVLDNHFEDEQQLGPEALSHHLVMIISECYAWYALKHPEHNEEDTLDEYINIIKQAIHAGIDDINEILENHNLLDTERISQIEACDSLMEEELANFVQTFGFNHEEEQQADEESELSAENFLDQDYFESMRL